MTSILLVHGAWADASSWSGVIPLLQDAGYKVKAVQNQLTSLGSDIANVKSVMDTIDGPILLVGHSYGGAVITGASHNEPKVIGLVYIAAFAPEEGESLNSINSKYPTLPSSQHVIPGAEGLLYLDPVYLPEYFAGDLPLEEGKVLAATQRPVGPDIFTDMTLGAGWKQHPSWYWVSSEDKMIQPRAEYDMAVRIGAHIITGQSSHVAMLSHPEDVAELILSAARNRRGGNVEIKDALSFSIGSIQRINAGVLSIGYMDMGPKDGKVVLLLHGWPYDIHSYVEVGPLLASAGYRVLIPYLRGYGMTRFLLESTPRNGQQSAFAVDMIAFLDELKVPDVILAGFDWGARTANIMATLWPERCTAMVSVSGYLITNQEMEQDPLPPRVELNPWWYQYYFSTERGLKGYTENRYDFNKLIWTLASPKWSFDDLTYDLTAPAFMNPDHVAIVINNYRWRLGLVQGESKYDELETYIQSGPPITVPTITIGSDFDGAGKDGKSYRSKFTGPYDHRVFNGVGHNVPQEAPKAFAQAILDADRMVIA